MDPIFDHDKHIVHLLAIPYKKFLALVWISALLTGNIFVKKICFVYHIPSYFILICVISDYDVLIIFL